MRFGSMFSGIEAASVAWEPLGWKCQWVAEIDKFPSAVLKHHYPDVPNLGDVTKVDWEKISATRPVDVIVFGSPCQSFSVAGKRLGLDDPRGNLALYALGVVNRLRPRFFLFENVPGLLSSDEGRDFAAFLRLVGECGYQCAWRILDAQYAGVPQRRRRLFVVGYLGDWRRAAAVLFERESLLRNPPPSRQARQGTPAGAFRSTDGGSDVDHARGGHLIPDVAPTMVANGNRTGGDRPYGTDGDTVTSLIPVIMSSGQANAEILEDGGAPSLTCLHKAPIVGYVPEVSATLVGRSSRGAGQTNSPGHNADQYLVAMSVDLQNVALGGDVAGTLDTTRPGRGGGQAVMATAFKASHFTRGKDGAPSDIVPPLSADADKGDQDTLALVPISFLSNASFPEHGIDIAGTLRTENLHAVAIPVGVEDVADPVLANVGKTYTQEGSRNFRLTNVVMAPIPIAADADRQNSAALTPSPDAEGRVRLRDPGLGIGTEGDPMFTLQATKPHAIAFSSKDHGADAGDVSPTLRSMGHDGSHANGGGQVAVAFMENVRGELRVSEQSDALTTGGGKPGQGYAAVLEPVPFDTTQITSPANYSSPQPGDPSHPLAAGAHPPAVVFESRFARNGRGAPDTIVPPLKAQSGETGKGDAAPLVAFSIMPMNSGKDYKARETDVAQPIMAGGPVGGNQGGDFIKSSMQVRRLTPRECERLQGFRDDYTLVPWRGKLAPDGPRYKALGNSFAVPVVRWIGERIQMVEDLVNGLDKKV